MWDFIDGAYGDEVTKRRNRAALDEVTVNPNFLVDVGERDLTTTVLGEETSFPVMISPAGGQMIAHPNGELAAARAANAAGTVYALASASGYGMEEVSKAAQGPLWFQFYHYSDEVTEYLLPIAKACGYSAICLTIDTPISAPKDRDIRNNYTPGPESRWGSLARRPELAKLRDVGVPDTISWGPARLYRPHLGEARLREIADRAATRSQRRAHRRRREAMCEARSRRNYRLESRRAAA